MKNKGFSLVEIIVAISIMAVLTLVLAPTMLMYMERARAQRDASAMDEIANAIALSVSYQEVYDELESYRIYDNVSCYIDSDTEADYEIVSMKLDDEGNVDQYTFDDESRKANGTKYYAAGNMRGTTITFERANHHSGAPILMEDAVINKFASDEVIDIEECPHLLSQLKLLVGPSLDISSETYRNSEFTIFVRFGPVNSNAMVDQDAMSVYGQFSGTNLLTNDSNYEKAAKPTDEE